MTDTNVDPVIGRALAADGVATTLAGFGGGSATTTYAENIGVMAATRVYSTAAYWIAAAVAIVLSLCPKVGAAISAIPPGVLGGATIVLYGLVGVLGYSGQQRMGDFGVRRALGATTGDVLRLVVKSAAGDWSNSKCASSKKKHSFGFGGSPNSGIFWNNSVISQNRKVA